jgi:hypothetical protein
MDAGGGEGGNTIVVVTGDDGGEALVPIKPERSGLEFGGIATRRATSESVTDRMTRTVIRVSVSPPVVKVFIQGDRRVVVSFEARTQSAGERERW